MFKKTSNILTIALAVLSAFISVGVVYIFHGCIGMHDGGFMRCHWAQQAIMATAGVLAVFYGVAFFVKNLSVRLGMLLSTLPVGILLILLANNSVILLCMSPDMHCRTTMQPVTILLSGVLIVVGIIAVIFTHKARKEQK